MSTVKFSLQHDLNKLQAEIYLLTNKKYSKQEIIEAIFRLGSKNIDGILAELTKKTKQSKYPLFEWVNKPIDKGEYTDSVQEHDVIL